MRWWLTVIALTTTIAVSGAQQPLTIQWLSFVIDPNNVRVPIRINPATGLVDLTNGVLVNSRFPSVSASGSLVVFQVGGGLEAQIWQAVFDANANRWQVSFVPVPDTNPPLPLRGLHPVISADGNYIAFASTQPYGGLNGTNNKQQVYVLDRLQNRIVPISVLWSDTDGDSARDTYAASLGNCVPVYISANGRIVVFLTEWLPDPSNPPQASPTNIVDADGDGIAEPVPPPPNNALGFWLVLIHDRDADGNGVFDEVGIGATSTKIASILGFDNDGDGRIDEDQADGIDNDNDGRVDEDDFDPVAPTPAASLSIAANGRFIAFVTTYDNDNDGKVDEDPEDNVDNDNDNQTDEDPPDERWRIIVRDWQSGVALVIDNAFAPTLSDDGTYLAYLTPTQVDNDGDGRLNEDPVDGNDNDNDGQVDEDPIELYPQASMDLVVRRLTDGRELRLSGLQPPAQAGIADGSSGYGYSDWWGAATTAIDPQNPDIVYVAFHSWSSNLIDLQNAPLDPQSKVNFYQGVPNIFVARFNFANNDVSLWHILPAGPQWAKPRGLPVSLELTANNAFRLPTAANLMPAASFVNNGQLFIVFQSLAPFEANDENGLWDVYLATVTLP